MHCPEFRCGHTNDPYRVKGCVVIYLCRYYGTTYKRTERWNARILKTVPNEEERTLIDEQWELDRKKTGWKDDEMRNPALLMRAMIRRANEGIQPLPPCSEAFDPKNKNTFGVYHGL